MTGAGKLVARLLMGDDVPDLKPFALDRYAGGPDVRRLGQPLPLGVRRP